MPCPLPSDINASTFPPNSPASHLLTTNDPPNEHQSYTFLDALARSRADLKVLDGEIAEAQKHLLGLQAKRVSLQNFVDEHAALHIRRLPTEILVRVFMLTLPSNPSPLHPEEAPLVLGQVCRLWRAVSRNTPVLWSTIKLETIEIGDPELRVPFLEWLERSRNCPLTVYYSQDIDDGLEWDVLAGIAARIEDLNIAVHYDELARLFSQDGCHSLDALKSLRLDLTHFLGILEFHEITQIDLGTRAPRLAHISIEHELTLQHYILPSIQITICDLGVNDTASFTLFLQEAVNLVDCTITIGPFNNDAPPRSPVRHTILEKLAIEVIQHPDSNVLGSILPCLDLPSLREFRWENHGYYSLNSIHKSQDTPEWPITIFLDFLSRSGCTLSKLWIDSGPTEEDILRYLVEVPSVIELTIGPGPIRRCPCELMQRLTLGSRSGKDGKDLVPNLEHLRICGSWHACEEMMQAIESRVSAVGSTTNGRRLKRVSMADLLVRGNALGNTQERLDKCVREGLLYEQFQW
ncbi:hypothetical protein FIBSPDRAFT_888171 [Athelia psychrophila]|uniref:F-box domain-containing protein n=1 Tax=Athelia psychrophila TaxID=1759441 RepID=A0A166NTH4_9AGAM|nr:hypothetical protein FIBSPDRAFT_888171 [Fibularhizoctonia sp. CBS 109695]